MFKRDVGNSHLVETIRELIRIECCFAVLCNLYLNNNHLTGGIPAQLANLTNLEILYLDHNQCSGGIPVSSISTHCFFRLALPKGSTPIKVSELHSKLNARTLKKVQEETSKSKDLASKQHQNLHKNPTNHSFALTKANAQSNKPHVVPNVPITIAGKSAPSAITGKAAINSAALLLVQKETTAPTVDDLSLIHLAASTQFLNLLTSLELEFLINFIPLRSIYWMMMVMGKHGDQSSDDNPLEDQEMGDTPAGHLAVHRPPYLNVEEALNWGNMADEEPFPSWETRADLAFEAAIAGNNNNDECIQLLQNVRSPNLNQHFPPLGDSIPPTSIHQKNPHSAPHQHFSHTQSIHSSPCGNFLNISFFTSQPSINSTNKSGSHASEHIPSPIRTRAQRKKGGTTTLPLHTQKKMSKAAKREANALSKLSKPSTTNSRHDPDEHQFQVLLADQKKREDNATTNATLHNPLEMREVDADPTETQSKTWKVCVYARRQ
ncbi:hypothetical protein LguiA_032587 [Lonicera macranthoides]